MQTAIGIITPLVLTTLLFAVQPIETEIGTVEDLVPRLATDDGCRECSLVDLGYYGCACHKGWDKFIECPNICWYVRTCDYIQCYAFSPESLDELDQALAMDDVDALSTMISGDSDISFKPSARAIQVAGCEGRVVREIVVDTDVAARLEPSLVGLVAD